MVLRYIKTLIDRFKDKTATFTLTVTFVSGMENIITTYLKNQLKIRNW